MTIRLIATALVAVCFLAAAFAEEKPVELKKGPDLDKIEGNCAACHRLV